MYNFENEIKRVADTQLHDFFGFDYFHDGYILTIDFTDDKTVHMKFACEREWIDKKNKEGYWIDNIYDETFHYNAYFKNCLLLRMEVSDFPLEYINGRFKNSISLETLNKESDNTNYHLRMQVVYGGYIDIIFSDFSIEKVKGPLPTFKDINLRSISNISEYFDDNSNITEIREISVAEHNYKRDWAIIHLYNLKDSYAVEAGLKELNSDEDDVQIASVFVLGELGEEEVIFRLFTLWNKTDYPIMKRHILDAIEKIKSRN